MKRYISVLLAVFVFVLGMPGTKTTDAAKVASEEVSRQVTVQPRLSSNETKSGTIKMHVMLENIDLNAYAKYTAELRKNAKYGDVVFAKAAPGSQVSITAEAGVIPGLLSKPAKDMNYSETIKYYNHKKIGTLKELTSLSKENGYGKKYTIPKDVEEVTAYVSVTYHVGFEVDKDKKTSTGTYHQEPAISRRYLVFTSDEACKKAYDLMTSNSVTGAIASVLGGDKKPSAKSDSKDSGGLGTAVKIGIAVVVLGAIGFGAYQLFGKGRGGGGKGSGVASSGAPVGSAADNKIKGAPTVTAPPSVEQVPDGYTGAKNVAGNTVNAVAERKSSAGDARMAGSIQNAAGQSAARTFCKNCGAELRPGTRFCEHCGAKNTPEFCINCGAKLESDNLFCGNCGAKL